MKPWMWGLLAGAGAVAALLAVEIQNGGTQALLARHPLDLAGEVMVAVFVGLFAYSTTKRQQRARVTPTPNDSNDRTRA